jgi:hypothetical protein
MPWICFGEEFCNTYGGDVAILTSKVSPHGHQYYIIVASKHLQLIPRPLEYTFLSWPTNPKVSNWQEIIFLSQTFFVHCVPNDCSLWQGMTIGNTMNQKGPWGIGLTRNGHYECKEPKTFLEDQIGWGLHPHHGWAITSDAVTPKVPYLYHWYLGSWSISPFLIHIIFKVTKFHLRKYCLQSKVLIPKKKVFVRK